MGITSLWEHTPKPPKKGKGAVVKCSGSSDWLCHTAQQQNLTPNPTASANLAQHHIKQTVGSVLERLNAHCEAYKIPAWVGQDENGITCTSNS